MRIQLSIAIVAALAACGGPAEPMTQPRQLTASPFQYPEELWDAGVEGESTLRLFITAQGGVDSARVERSSGYAAFDSAALAGSRVLRFEPARRGTEPVGAWFILPVTFDLGPAGATRADPATAPSPSRQPSTP